MLAQQSEFRRRMLALGSGGPVRGAGSGTSDSIPARLSDGEFVLPADTVRKVGLKSLRDLVHMTHAPTGRPAHPARFADGGLVDERRRPNSFGDAAAGALANTGSPPPAAPAGGLQGVADRLGQIPTGGLTAPAADGSQSSWTNTEAGRNITNAASALPGVAGALPAVARTGGAISGGLTAAQRLLNVGAGVAGASALPAPAAAAPAPPATAGAGAGRGVVNPEMADPSKPLPSPSASVPGAPGYGPIGDRTTLTNEQAATMNPAGRITVTRGANGTMEFSGNNVSGQVSYNDPSGKALPGGGINGKGFSDFQVAPAGSTVATGPNGSYAYSTSGSQGAASAAPADARSRLLAIGSMDSGQLSVNTGDPMADRARAESLGRLMASGQIAAPAAGPSLIMSGNTGFRRDRSIVAGELGAQRALAYAQGNDPASRKRAASLHEVAMRLNGENYRANLDAQRHADANNIARARLVMDQAQAGFQNRSAQRVENAQLQLESAKTPQEQRSARERLMALIGKNDGEMWAHSPGGQMVDPKTQQLITQPGVIYNRRTGETRVQDGGQAAAQTNMPPPSARPVGGRSTVNGKTAVWDGQKWVPQA